MILRLPLSLEPSEFLIPHLADKSGEILPVIQILETLELTPLALVIIWLELQVLGVDLEGIGPLVTLL